jgi:hypothetical protein
MEVAMDEVKENHTCAVCGLNPGDVCASWLGPTSYARCKTCIDQSAESIGVICLRIFLQGGPAGVEKNASGDLWPHGIKTYLGGRYIGWQEILAVYPEYEAAFNNHKAPD